MKGIRTGMDRKLIFLDIDGTLISAMSAPSALAREGGTGSEGEWGIRFSCVQEGICQLSEGIFWILGLME